jgi:transcriptional regulator with XRE-family HTH domain
MYNRGNCRKNDRLTKSIASASDRKPHPVDIHVGKRIRMRRSLMAITQEKLAESVGLTFQQIQKYERGTNRVSASRLFQFSKILDVPISYFYEEFYDSRDKKPVYAMADNDQDPFVNDDTLYSRETLDLLKIYYGVTDEQKRRELLKILRSMVETMRPDK